MNQVDYLAAQALLDDLARKMRANSERWFPRWHDGSTGMPLDVAYTLGLAGEVGEVANAVKKIRRDGETYQNKAQLAEEIADVFTYLMLLCNETGIHIIHEYVAKTAENEERFA